MELYQIIKKINDCKSVNSLSKLFNYLGHLDDVGKIKLTSSEYFYICNLFNEKRKLFEKNVL